MTRDAWIVEHDRLVAEHNREEDPIKAQLLLDEIAVIEVILIGTSPK